MSTYVFELGCEELPSSALPGLRDQFVALLAEELLTTQLDYTSLRPIAAPRRLGAQIMGLATQSRPKAIERRGPALNAAFRDGAPTPALLGFCKGLGIDPSQVTTEETDKGAWVVYRGEEPGQPAAALLPGLISKVLDRLAHTKPMRWGSGRDEFPRPVHWILSLLDQEVIPVSAFGLSAGAITYGHRFHSPNAFTLNMADEYAAQMEAHYVLPFFTERADKIWSSVKALAQDHALTVKPDTELLEEICCLVEWPVPLCGDFEAEFLEVPDIALIAAMRGHQKYFHCFGGNEKLSNHFITVANIESRDPQQVIAGNQRVIRARLSDARFFYKTDRQTTLATRRPALDQITFHPQLGSLGEKTERVKALCVNVAKHAGLDVAAAERAASLSRCDLVSEMVLEFDELQGQMGEIYAHLDQEPDGVSRAIGELYKPAGAHDSPPTTALGSALALADRLDTLAGLFAAGQPPSGNKDPFALRRAAISLIRVNAHPSLHLDLVPWLQEALEAQPVTAPADSLSRLVQFIQDRERVRLTDAGLRHDVVVASQNSDRLNTHGTELRAQALNAFLDHPDFEGLVGGNKRIANLLSKGQFNPTPVDVQLFAEPEERVLFDALVHLESQVAELVSRETFADALTALARLRPPVDAFFDKVMVNAEQLDIRQNRYSLLHRIRQLFLLVGDLSQIQA